MLIIGLKIAHHQLRAVGGIRDAVHWEKGMPVLFDDLIQVTAI